MSLHSRSGRSSSRSGFVCSFEKLRVRQESLSGNSKTVMIAALSPALSNLDETLSTFEVCGVLRMPSRIWAHNAGSTCGRPRS